MVESKSKKKPVRKPSPTAIMQRLILKTLQRIETKIDNHQADVHNKFKHVFTQYDTTLNNYRYHGKRVNELLERENKTASTAPISMKDFMDIQSNQLPLSEDA